MKAHKIDYKKMSKKEAKRIFCSLVEKNHNKPPKKTMSKSTRNLVVRKTKTGFIHR